MTPAPRSLPVLPVAARATAALPTSRRAAAAPVTVLADQAQFAALIGRQLVACRHHGVRHAVILVEIELPPRIGNTADAPLLAQLIEAAAARLRARLRDTDLVAQLGGQRFGVILIDAAKADLSAVQARLHKAICGHYGIESRLLYVVARLGAAMYPGGGSTGTELVRAADTALAKSSAESPWASTDPRQPAALP